MNQFSHYEDSSSDSDLSIPAPTTEKVYPANDTSQRCLWMTNERTCMKLYPDWNSLTVHARRRHAKTNLQSFVCYWKDCSRGMKPLSSRSTLVSHLRTHTGENSYVCGECQSSFGRLDTLKRHEKTHNEYGSSSPSSIEVKRESCVQNDRKRSGAQKQSANEIRHISNNPSSQPPNCSSSKKEKSDTEEHDNSANVFRLTCDSSTFDFKKVLAKGSMGVVREATQGDDTYAIKTIHFTQDEKKEINFILDREVLNAGRLCHRNIIDFYGFVTEVDHIHLLFEKAEMSVSDVLKKEKLLVESVAGSYYYQLMDALKYLHGVGMIHRDIKPDNLLISKNGDLKVADFGSSSLASLGRKETIVGTIGYLAPEMMKNESYTTAVDIWSAGVTLVECLCGKSPFAAGFGSSMQKSKLVYPQSISEEAVALIQRMIVHKPSKRATAAEIFEDKWIVEMYRDELWERKRIAMKKINNHGFSNSPSPTPSVHKHSGPSAVSILDSSEEARQWQSSFGSLLKNRRGCALFRDFLEKEYSHENLDFWLACEEFKKMKDGKTSTALKAKQIYKEFVAEKAPREVNLDGFIRAATLSALNTGCKTNTFDLAQKEIETLMQKDPYRRFLQDRVFLNLLKDCGSKSGAGELSNSKDRN